MVRRALPRRDASPPPSSGDRSPQPAVRGAGSAVQSLQCKAVTAFTAAVTAMTVLQCSVR
jgi:hypothetical protein